MQDPEADGRGLLLTELLELAKRFSWKRYREDVGGFLLAWGFVLALMLLLAGIARAQDIPAADARFQVRDTNTPMKFTPYPTREAWLERAAYLREQTLMAAGLWPMPDRTPLNAQIFGRITREGYTIEKAYFESYPGFYCTGNLYRPIPSDRRKPPFPAVWSPHGHWAYGRLEHTEVASVPARAIDLARQGYVVFTPDMVGYNDSTQIGHQFGGRRQQLWGINVLGLQLWNSIRGVDFLQSLPDVDPNRIVMTGASGGATQAFLAAAVDDRIKAVVPVNMISALMQGGSNCENAANLRLDTFNVEISALTAPRPMLMVAATGDWTRNTPRDEYPAVRSIYQLLGAEDHLAMQQFLAPHNYNSDSRTAMYKFFGRWMLQDTDESHFKDRSIHVEFPTDMLVFYGRERPAGVTEQSLTEQRIADSERQLAALRGSDHFREVMGTALRHSVAAEMPAPADVVAQESVIGRRGRGDRIPLALLRPKQASRNVVLLIHPDGKEAATKSPLASELQRRGITVFSVDVFQTGDHRGTRDTSSQFFTTYNRTDDAERVQDILTALAYLKTQYSTVDLVGVGRAGLWVMLARALAPADAVRRTIADADQFASDDDAAYLDKLFIPLLRRAGDFRTALALIAPAPLFIHNTGAAFRTDWAQATVRQEAASDRELLAWLAAP